MNASSSPIYIASARKTANFYIDAPSSSGSSSYSPWGSPELSVSYDHRGRLQPFVETEEQRRARVEFMRKREFSRRISAWLADSKSENSESIRKSSSSSSSDCDSLHTIDEDDESSEADMIIYSTSPAPGMRWPVSTPSSYTVTNNAYNNTSGASRPRHLRTSSRTSSFSSLSSISEEDAPCV
ncbi:hypothetical protein BDW22DRAFT_1432002 [Trametopsis cervina]|nr:hypothetical protein BDW22DRAFT_1432002 [Trametopsis cervina]